MNAHLQNSVDMLADPSYGTNGTYPGWVQGTHAANIGYAIVDGVSFPEALAALGTPAAGTQLHGIIETAFTSRGLPLTTTTPPPTSSTPTPPVTTIPPTSTTPPVTTIPAAGFDVTTIPILGPIIGQVSTATGISPMIVTIGAAAILAYVFGVFDDGGKRR